ncbi:hypothetical protein J6590_077327 [Homalodisca vitripennis]|nr:hypothetical protein J6590_077327 [Homalodisca vitripennis]
MPLYQYNLANQHLVRCTMIKDPVVILASDLGISILMSISITFLRINKYLRFLVCPIFAPFDLNNVAYILRSQSRWNLHESSSQKRTMLLFY